MNLAFAPPHAVATARPSAAAASDGARPSTRATMVALGGFDRPARRSVTPARPAILGHPLDTAFVVGPAPVATASIGGREMSRTVRTDRSRAGRLVAGAAREP